MHGPGAAVRAAAHALSARLFRAGGAIPDKFDWRFYRQAYPEPTADAQDPAAHFARSGMRAGRYACLADLASHHGGFAADKPFALCLAGADGRFDGFDLAGWAVATLARDYNLIVIGGPCAEASAHARTWAWLPAPRADALADHPVLQLVQGTRFHLCICNDWRLRAVLPLLYQRLVPTVALVDATLAQGPHGTDRLAYLERFATRLVFAGASSARPMAGVLARALDKAAHDTAQRREVVALIEESGLFRADVAARPRLAPAPAALPAKAILDYLADWGRGHGRRKPLPGFHPAVYRELHGVAHQGADPLVDFLRAGRPAGPWRQPLITEHSAAHWPLLRLRAALHIHAYYPDLVPGIVERLALNRCTPDLFISAPDQAALDRTLGMLGRRRRKQVVEACVVPNRGRDIGPLLSQFGARLVARYDVIGHLHTKRSAHAGHGRSAGRGDRWRDFLLENLLGGRGGAMLDRIMYGFAADAALGLVYADDPHVFGWDANRDTAQRLATCLGMGLLPESFCFPVGNMFWVRSGVLAPLVGLRLDWRDYPAEPIANDGTLLHAIERLPVLLAAARRYHTAATNVTGVTY